MSTIRGQVLLGRSNGSRFHAIGNRHGNDMDAKRSLRWLRDTHHEPMPEVKRLSNSAREELSDVKLLMESISHNLQLVIRGTPGQAIDVDQALENAHSQLTQILSTLERIKNQRGGRT
jgi:hypothetical protein